MNNINIAMSFTSDWAKYARVVLYSILKNNNVNNIYLFTDKPVKFNNIQANVYNIIYNDIIQDIQDLNRTERYSSAPFVKFFIPEIIKDVDRVLYVDCDVIVDGSLADLFTIDLQNKKVGMVGEWGYNNNYVGYSQEGEFLLNYYSNGIILYNLIEMRNEELNYKFIDLLNKYEYFLPDQDVFNVMYKDNVYSLEDKWNHTNMESLDNDIVIYHWGGCDKSNWIYNELGSSVWTKYEQECNIQEALWDK